MIALERDATFRKKYNVEKYEKNIIKDKAT